jgi:hypothetical protein
MTDSEIRTAWVATCVFWAWSWATSAVVCALFTIGISLLGLIPAALSVFAIWIPIGKPQQSVVYHSTYPPLPQYPPTQYRG